MKKIIYSLIVLFALVSCEKEAEKVKPVWDSTATITIRPAKGVKTRTVVGGLAAIEIVEKATSIHYTSHYVDNKYDASAKTFSRAFNADMKDFEIPALKMLAIDVISAEGDYYRDLTNATDFYIVEVDDPNNRIDTLAFVPDEVISSARPLIEEAFNNQNYDEVYRLFDEAFTFLPIE
ncbi:MAG: hypothetical protein PHN55_12050 [Dysgonamonadaceae bacterium]|nr:hypothetical protein [Dysgonamonadaceae bacterium]